MKTLTGPSAWAVLRLRNEASLLRERKRQVQDYGYLPHELASLSDAASATDRMAASIEAGDRRSLRQNLAEFDKFVDYAGSASPYGWKPGKTPVDEVVADWERDLCEEDAIEREDEDSARSSGSHHPVKAYNKGDGERVRAHLARNPRRSRKRIAA